MPPTTIAPSGGSDAPGQQPWACCVPSGGDPVMLDTAMSVVARARSAAPKRGRCRFPDTWATDVSSHHRPARRWMAFSYPWAVEATDWR